MAIKKPFISPAITDVPLRQTLQSMIDNSSSESVIVGDGPPPDTGASGGTPYYDASSNNLYIFNDGAYTSVHPKLGGNYSYDVGSIEISSLTSSEVAYYWDIASSGKKPVDNDVIVLISTAGSFTYIYNGSNKIKVLSDESEIDVNSWGKQAAYVNGDMIINGSVSADAVNANFISGQAISAGQLTAGTISANEIVVANTLDFGNNGGFKYNKDNWNDPDNGLFFGRKDTGSGFALHVENSGTSNANKRKLLVTEDTLELINPSIKTGLSGNYSSANVVTTTSTGAISNNISSYDSVQIVLVGGGGGGGSSYFDTQGSAGGSTQVTVAFNDGTSNLVLSASGGAGGVSIGRSTDGNPANGEAGTSTIFGAGGAGGSANYGAGSNATATHYGAGGGGRAGQNYGNWTSSVGQGLGGGAAEIKISSDITRSTISSITVNSIGAGGNGGTSAGNGAGGAVQVKGVTYNLADVKLVSTTEWTGLYTPSFGEVGTYCWARATADFDPGWTTSGSNLKATSWSAHHYTYNDSGPSIYQSGSALGGTWRCMGQAVTYTTHNATLWVRIS